MSWIGIQAEFVVTAAQILDERMSSANHSGRAKPFQPTHRSQPALEPTMIGFDGIVRVLLHDVARGGQQLIDHPRVGRRPISAHLSRAWAMLESAGEESVSGRQIPVLRDEDVDDLAILVDRPVQINPAPGDLDVSLIDEPPITRRVQAGPGRINQQQGEPLHPPIHAHVIDGDATLSQQLYNVAVGEPVAQVPANRNRDHIRREAKPREAGPQCWHSTRATTHRPRLTDLALHRRNSPLERAIRQAQARDKVRRNVANLIMIPEGKQGHPSKAMTLDQAARLLEALESETDSRLAAYVVLSLLTGIRTEEARALTWAEVDLNAAPWPCTAPYEPKATPRPARADAY